MAEFTMPSLGADMDDGTLVEWLVGPGDTVERGDIVAVVETQKGAIEIEIFEDGTVTEILVPVGTTVLVGAPLAMINGAGEEAPAKPAPAAATPPVSEPAPVAAPAPKPVATPRPTPGDRRLISPRARRLAAERGIDLATISGSGPRGEIISKDLDSGTTAPAKRTKPGLDPGEMRKAIAAAMSRSQREIPHYYVTQTIDASALMVWLSTRNAEKPPTERLLSAVPLLKATALALHKTPELNGTYAEDQFRPSDHIHIGVAVALRGGGLIAPAIHDLDSLSLTEIMDKLRDLVARVRAGRLRSSEMADPTVTVTNLGDDHAEGMFPIIYPPQVAIVGFGSITQRPWVVGNQVTPRPLLSATIGADHRVSDGRLGSRFLCTLRDILQEPEKL